MRPVLRFLTEFKIQYIMDIVYNCDDNYAVHTAVSITSIFENNHLEESIRIYILGNHISEESKRKLRSIGDIYAVTDRMSFGKNSGMVPNNFRREVHIIDLENFEQALKLLIGNGIDAGRFTITALARIFAPQNLPEDVERYIYLDCDTVVTRELNMLYTAKLSGMTAGLAPEPTIYPEVREYLGMEEDMPYFNTGMMLVDRREWEKNNITGKCVDFYREKNGRLPFSDQDIINYVLKGKVKVLWQGYDFFSNYHYRSYKSLVRLAPWYGKIMSRKDYDGARRLPAVVHFAGDERPWIKGNFNPYRDIYEKYLELSPWAGTEKISGKEREMLLYHIMNLVTMAAPQIRDYISHRYYNTKVKSS